MLNGFIQKIFVFITLTTAIYSPFCVASVDNIPHQLPADALDLMVDYSKNPLKWPALHYAIDQERPDVALLVLKLYPEQALLRTPSIKIMESYMGNNADQDYDYIIGHELGKTALKLAIDHNYVDLTSSLLKLGADVNANHTDHKALRWADWKESREAVKERVKFVNGYYFGRNYESQSLLCLALKAENLEIIELLLEHDVKFHPCLEIKRPNQVYELPDSIVIKDAFSVAADIESDKFLRKLLYFQASRFGTDGVNSEDDIDDSLISVFRTYIKNPLGWPPLHYAVYSNDLDAFRLLLEYGMDPDYQGSAPKDLRELIIDQSEFGQVLSNM